MDGHASSATSLGDVFDLFERFGDDPYDEELAQTQHALQTAALAAADGASDALVAAALLHDVGHLLDLARASATGAHGVPADVDLGHEATGARWLAGIFDPELTAPIALHVRAKRYLAATEAGYLQRLSAGSQRSLELQGGPFTAAEVAAFERNPGASDAVRLRRWDDHGKVQGLDVPQLTHYREMLTSLLTT